MCISFPLVPHSRHGGTSAGACLCHRGPAIKNFKNQAHIVSCSSAPQHCRHCAVYTSSMRQCSAALIRRARQRHPQDRTEPATPSSRTTQGLFCQCQTGIMLHAAQFARAVYKLSSRHHPLFLVHVFPRLPRPQTRVCLTERPRHATELARQVSCAAASHRARCAPLMDVTRHQQGTTSRMWTTRDVVG